ncbi:deleted in malignant brain tumors 1 protein-like [Patiria miniata]|uniref:SRCR domain-containing protein n=1 Tax=Patiria miniata TaxID=46514 RepID=A0A913ZKS9_PATMI|nr:deleted in malignant brain tumors 1 protein-like [Patiria miniata]
MTTLSVSVRLVNGEAPNEGRVEVYYKCHWGTICQNDWSIRDANVICRQLGYPSASQAWHSAHFGRGSGVIVLSNVACRGNESSIDLCHHSGWYVTSGCNHYGDAGVTCDLTSPEVTVRLINGNAPNEGSVEVQYRGQSGSVCGYNPVWRIEEANVVCRQLGYPSASQAWQNAHFGQGSGPILLVNVACDGYESRIDQCDYRGWLMSSCIHSHDVGVTCDVTTPAPVVVRLANGNTPHEGRVEVFYRCEWGTICGRHWGIEEANVVCRQLGYISATQARWYAHFGQGSEPILLNNVVCRGSELRIDQCDHTGWYNHDCSYHSYDVGVTCNETSPNPVPVRLTNGSFPYEGRIEIYHDGQWGTVCDDGWSIEDANVTCRQLGYPPASQAWQGSHFGEGSGPILLRNVACNGTESNIDLCEHSGWFNHSCSHAEDAGVTCGEQLIVNDSSPVSVRLVNGNAPNEGRVEVYYKCHWGTICHNGWSIRDAHVICRQLGYPSASQAWHSAHFGRGSGPILLSNVACRGNESSIDQCDHSGWHVTSGCRHYSDAGVTCYLISPQQVSVRLINGNAPNEGTVEVNYTGQWGSVCGNNPVWRIEEANVVCRQLGYPSAFQAWSNAHFGRGSGPVVLENVACDGHESRIDQCDSVMSSCSHYYDVGVTCDVTTPSLVVVRLADGNTPHEGRVEVFYRCEWGTICGTSHWGIEEANVICRQLGYISATQAWRNAHFGQGSGPILLNSVVCRGSESSIDQCDHAGWYNEDCLHHTYDAGVTCNETSSSPVPVRLTNGSFPYEGRIEIYHDGQWGTVCDDGWSIEDANVICRQLGYPPASQAWQGSHFGEGSGPILLSNVACNGTESNIDLCEHSGWFNHSCSHAEDAGVTCGEQLIVNDSSPVSVRLVNGEAPSEGRVEIYYKCHWGTICDSGWSIRHAHVICRQLGYPSASQAWQRAHFGQGSGPILLNSVACQGNESSIDQCQHSGWYGSYGCRHNRDAGVTCDLTSPQVTVRLINGNAPNEGAVEVQYRGQWGSVCGSNWRTEEANVVCRQLGYPSAFQAWSNAHFGRGSGPVVLKNVACDGHESRIDQCDFRGWLMSSCSHYYDVGVTCDVTTPSPEYLKSYIAIIIQSTLVGQQQRHAIHHALPLPS